MVELNNMSKGAIAAVALAAIVLAGIAIVSQYSVLLRADTTVNLSTTTLLTTDNGTAVAVGTTGQYPFLQDIDNCINESNTTRFLTKTTDYVFSEGDADGGTFTLINNDFDGEGINCSTLQYLADTSAQSSADDFTTGLAIFGTFLAVIVLSIVGKLIVGIFRPKDI